MQIDKPDFEITTAAEEYTSLPAQLAWILVSVDIVYAA